MSSRHLSKHQLAPTERDRAEAAEADNGWRPTLTTVKCTFAAP